MTHGIRETEDPTTSGGYAHFEGFGPATDARLDPGMTAGRAKAIYEQLLSLADRMSAAYVDAYQKIIAGISGEQDRFVNPDHGDGPKNMASMLSSVGNGDALNKAAQRGVQLSDTLLEMSTRIGLAYVDAHEQAALAAADCREALASESPSELVRTIASARAELIREIARTCASTAREICD